MIETRRELKRSIGLFSCIMLVSGNMIGVGIFTTPGSVARALGSPGWVLLAWSLGGFLALSGALSFGELGAMYPEAGGTYVFLREAYGRPWAFLSGWIFSVIITPGVVAVLAIGFAAYLGFPQGWPCKLVAIGAIVVLAAINYRGVALSALFQDVSTFGKIVGMMAFVVIGIAIGQRAPETFHAAGSGSMSSLAVALIPVMYTYSGWNAAVLVGGEIENPGRTIPWGLLLGTVVVTVAYLAMNALYLYAVPLLEMRGDMVVAQTAARNLFEPVWAKAIALLIAFSSLGCLNATILTGPRVPYAMSKDGLFFKAFEWVHPRFSSPGKAIVFQMTWAVLLALTGTFDQLLDWVTVPSLLISLFCVAGLIRLRSLRPEASRPYRVWAYPFLPILFILTVIWILINNFVQNPKDSLMGFVLIALGVPVYLYWARRALTPSLFVLHKPYPVADESLLVNVPFVRPGKPPARARPEAAEAFRKMTGAAGRERISLIIVSAFRSWQKQETCFLDARRRHGEAQASLWVAPPGYSEHHTGYVFDIGDRDAPEADDGPLFEKTDAFLWLKNNGNQFGFELSFPPRNPGRVSYEPWHWRYVGSREAQALFHPLGLTNLALWGRAAVRKLLDM